MKKQNKNRLLGLLLMTASQMVMAGPYAERGDVQQYLDQIANEHDLSRSLLQQLFEQIEPQQKILEAISRPAEKALTWAQYRPIFIKAKRIEAGQQFMIDHADTLARAEAQYGVPASVISSIIGVETFYGRITGKHTVLDALATLAFDYPPRSKFFKKELTEFLVLSRAENWDTAGIKGSYAGAMGWPQFISSSYRQYAVDFNGDGKRDLLNSVEDAIGSVGNYLSQHGWQRGALVAEPWVDTGPHKQNVAKLVRDSLKPTILPESLRKLGFAADTTKPVSVMQFEGKDGLETWVGYGNFYAITRYNHSSMYALAVHQLSQALR